jgi:hypothetical protein
MRGGVVYLFFSKECPHCDRYIESGRKDAVKRYFDSRGRSIQELDCTDKNSPNRSILLSTGFTTVPAIAYETRGQTKCESANEFAKRLMRRRVWIRS